jgi:hypothetical protein
MKLILKKPPREFEAGFDKGGVWYLPEFLISNWKWRVNEAYS